MGGPFDVRRGRAKLDPGPDRTRVWTGAKRHCRVAKPEDCVPKDKFDIAAVERARSVGFPALTEVLPRLLVWLQDCNWPVAEPVASLLPDAGIEILPHLREVLSSDDGAWKYSVLTLLVPDLDPQIIAGLTDDLARLATHPTAEDRAEGVDQAARDLLAPE